jgi:hypothetical protein
MINRIKGNRFVTAALIFVFGLSVCGCGGKDASTGDTVSMYDLRTAMEAADTSLPEMTVLSKNDENAESLFTDNISDMDYDKIDDFFVSYAVEGKNADEIVVIAVKDKNDVNTAKQTLEDHRESRRKLFEQYEPEQVKRIEDGIIFTEKQYAVLIICDNRDGVRKTFEEAV